MWFVVGQISWQNTEVITIMGEGLKNDRSLKYGNIIVVRNDVGMPLSFIDPHFNAFECIVLLKYISIFH